MLNDQILQVNIGNRVLNALTWASNDLKLVELCESSNGFLLIHSHMCSYSLL